MALPTTLAELDTARAAAGARYAAAITELEAAFIDLAAYDIALNNNNVVKQGGLVKAPSFDASYQPGITGIHGSLRHPSFGTYNNDWRGQINSISAQVIKSIAG